ncbi:MAG: HAD family phosphatase [Bacteroidia bacterium]|nr:HAD family phosphatase [Bacteroidia bacterium]
MHFIFDCDGVIIDSEILYAQIAVQKLASVGYHTDTLTYCRRFSGMMDAAILEIISRENNIYLSPDFHDELKNEAAAAFQTQLLPISGMGDLIRNLALPVSIVSNSHLEHVQHGLSRAGIHHVPTTHIFTSQMVNRPKPAPDLYQFAIQTQRLTPTNCIVVEDSEAGVTAAKAAGLTVVGFLGGGHITENHGEKLRRIGVDYLVQDAGELATLFREKGLMG